MDLKTNFEYENTAKSNEQKNTPKPEFSIDLDDYIFKDENVKLHSER